MLSARLIAVALVSNQYQLSRPKLALAVQSDSSSDADATSLLVIREGRHLLKLGSIDNFVANDTVMADKHEGAHDGGRMIIVTGPNSVSTCIPVTQLEFGS